MTKLPLTSLQHESIASLFSKRSTRAHFSAETASPLLGGRALFLRKENIQLGMSKNASDTTKDIGNMCQEIFAGVGEHEKLSLIRNSLDTQQYQFSTLYSHYGTQRNSLRTFLPCTSTRTSSLHPRVLLPSGLSAASPLTISRVGGSSNFLHDMLFAYARLGHKLRVRTPSNPKYHAPAAVWDKIKEVNCEKGIFWTGDPREAVKGADVVVTDTWIYIRQNTKRFND